MKEKTLPIYKKDNYNNIYLKTKYERKGKNLIIQDGKKILKHEGLNHDEYIIVTKEIKEGKQVINTFGNSYICRVTYNGETCSFFLNETEHEIYKDVAEVGEQVKISMTIEKYIHKISGVEMEKQKLTFTKI